MKVVWIPRAQQCLQEIHDHIAQDQPGNAVRWVSRVLDRGEQISDQPRSGRVVPEHQRAEFGLHIGYQALLIGASAMPGTVTPLASTMLGWQVTRFNCPTSGVSSIWRRGFCAWSVNGDRQPAQALFRPPAVLK